MRKRTHRVLSAASLALTYSCASTSGTALKPQAAEAELTSMRARQSEQDHRIVELESRIALLEADARKERSGSDGAVRSGETVRIGGEHALTAVVPTNAEPAAREDVPRELDEGRSAKRPKLRLYGKGEGTRSSGDIASPALPGVPVVSETLPVAPLPEQRAAGQQRAQAVPAASAAEGGGGDSVLASYRTGLRLLRERHFAEAAQAFGVFIDEHPSHELVASAHYWRGEAHYARRDYAAARVEFESLVTRFPRADKAADALLKLALCYRQLGVENKAKEALRRLRADYPNSQAASTAAREGST